MLLAVIIFFFVNFPWLAEAGPSQVECRPISYNGLRDVPASGDVPAHSVAYRDDVNKLYQQTFATSSSTQFKWQLGIGCYRIEDDGQSARVGLRQSVASSPVVKLEEHLVGSIVGKVITPETSGKFTLPFDGHFFVSWVLVIDGVDTAFLAKALAKLIAHVKEKRADLDGVMLGVLLQHPWTPHLLAHVQKELGFRLYRYSVPGALKMFRPYGPLDGGYPQIVVSWPVGGLSTDMSWRGHFAQTVGEMAMVDTKDAAMKTKKSNRRTIPFRGTFFMPVLFFPQEQGGDNLATLVEQRVKELYQAVKTSHSAGTSFQGMALAINRDEQAWRNGDALASIQGFGFRLYQYTVPGALEMFKPFGEEDGGYPRIVVSWPVE